MNMNLKNMEEGIGRGSGVIGLFCNKIPQFGCRQKVNNVDDITSLNNIKSYSEVTDTLIKTEILEKD